MDEHNKKILIIDDDKDIRALLRVYLKKRGYETDEVESGNAAIDILKNKGMQHGFNLFIIDQVMPGLDGISTFQELQKIDGRIAAIMFTGFPTISLSIRFIQQGGINFLTKPFDPRSEVLVVIIQEAINYKRIKRAQKEIALESSSGLLTFADEKQRSEAIPISCNPVPWKLLIVDDDESVHRSIKLMLDKFIFDSRPLEFYSVYSGKEAERWLDSNQDVALVLVDTIMETEFAGFEVIRHIREVMGNCLIRIILQNEEHGDLPEQKVIIDHEINGFLTKKELSIQELAIMISTTLRSYRDLLIVEKQRQVIVSEFEAISQEMRILQARINGLEGQLVNEKPLSC